MFLSTGWACLTLEDLALRVQYGMRPRVELPLKVLEKNIGNVIFVKLKDGTEYIGKLESSDLSMNLILSDAKQVSDTKEVLKNYGVILIRGSNILYISVEPDKVTFYEQES